jgi:hypothetical protein
MKNKKVSHQVQESNNQQEDFSKMFELYTMQPPRPCKGKKRKKAKNKS